MKIINKINVGDWRHKHTCRDCSTEVELDATDMKHETARPERNETTSVSFFYMCPICAKKVFINKDVMPKAVQIAIERGYRITTQSVGNSSQWDDTDQTVYNK